MLVPDGRLDESAALPGRVDVPGRFRYGRRVVRVRHSRLRGRGIDHRRPAAGRWRV